MKLYDRLLSHPLRLTARFRSDFAIIRELQIFEGGVWKSMGRQSTFPENLFKLSEEVCLKNDW